MAADSTVRVRFLGDASGAMRATSQLKGQMSGLSRASGLLGKALAIGVVGGLALAVKAAIDFDKSMRNVNSIAKLSEGQFKSLQKSVLAMAKDTAQAPKQLADGLYDIVSSGFKAKDGLKILRASAIAATAGMTDTATSVKAVVSVLNAYHMSADQAGKVSDILFQTVNKGVLTFEELASQIGDVLPIASQLGVPLEDVGAALATITLHGVSAAEASTQLKQVYVSILKPSKDLSAEIERMGFASGEAAIKTLGLEGFMRKLTDAAHGSGAAFADWFPNVRAMNGALGITGKNISSLHDNILAMKDSQGAASAAFEEQSKSISVQWQRVKASLTAAAIPIGQLLFPALEKAMGGVGAFADALQSHLPAIQAGFSNVGQGLSTVASTLGTVTDKAGLGSGALITFATGAAVVSGMTKLKAGIAGISLSLGALGPYGMAAAAALTVLGAGFLIGAVKGDYFDRTLKSINQTLGAQAAASNAVSATQRNTIALRQAQSTLLLQIEGGEKLYAKSVAATGAKSLESRTIANSLTTARQQLKQVTGDLATSEKQHGDAVIRSKEEDKHAAAALTQKRAALQSVIKEEKESQDAQNKGFILARVGSKIMSTLSGDTDKTSRAVQTYASAVANAAKAQGASITRQRDLKKATLELYEQFGKLPKVPEIKVKANFDQLTRPAMESGFEAGKKASAGLTAGTDTSGAKKKINALGDMKPKTKLHVDSTSADYALNKLRSMANYRLPTLYQTIEQKTVKRKAEGGVVYKARGGVIPGAGNEDTVPAMLTPGEVVLNRRQQKRLAKLLGVSDTPEAVFSAAEHFARGGIVRPTADPHRNVPIPKGRKGKKPKKQKTVASTLPEVWEIMKDVKFHQDRIEQLGEDYSYQERKADLTDEEFFTEVTDPVSGETYQVVNVAGVQARIAELQGLEKIKQDILRELDAELAALKIAIGKLRAGIAKLKAEIRKQTRRAQIELQSINALEAVKRTIEKMAPTPDRDVRLANVNELITYHKNQRKDALRLRDAERAKLGPYQTGINDAKDLVNDIPNERREQQLDWDFLQKDIDALLGLKSEAPSAAGAGGGEGGGGEGGGGGGGGGEGDSEEVHRLRAIIGQLRLALGIQAAQLGVLDDFGGFAPGGGGGAAPPASGGGANAGAATGRRRPAGGLSAFARGGVIRGPQGRATLILAHGGEMVLNPGQQARLGGTVALARTLGFKGFQAGGIVEGPGTQPVRGPGQHGAAGQPAEVHITLENGMEWLSKFIRVEAVGATDAIATRLGRSADRRVREGRV